MFDTSNIIDLAAHRSARWPAARPAARPGAAAPARAYTPSEMAALSFEGGERVLVRRPAWRGRPGLVARGVVETITLINGGGRIGIRVGAGHSTGALASFDALDVEPDLAAALHGDHNPSALGGHAAARPTGRPHFMCGPDRADAREDQK